MLYFAKSAKRRAYVRGNELDFLVGIYEKAETLAAVTEAGLPVIPFFWERKPRRPQIPDRARGLKLHPYIERYVLGPESVGEAMLEARRRRLPVLIHSDDREPELSRGVLFGRLAAAFPEVPIIIAHSGSYAPYSEDDDRPLVDVRLTEELVREAIDVAAEHENVLLEVSVLASPTKTRLIAFTAPAKKVLLGSDFPIQKETVGSISYQERALLNVGLTASRVRLYHENARRLLLSPG